MLDDVPHLMNLEQGVYDGMLCLTFSVEHNRQYAQKPARSPIPRIIYFTS